MKRALAGPILLLTRSWNPQDIPSLASFDTAQVGLFYSTGRHTLTVLNRVSATTVRTSHCMRIWCTSDALAPSPGKLE